MDKKKFFGVILRRLRNQAGISQEELGARVEVSRSHIGRFETGEKTPNLRMLFRLADALDVKASVIIAEVENQKERSCVLGKKKGL